MKKFEKNGKLNFVDDNNVFIGFDYTPDCCEVFGYGISKKENALYSEEMDIKVSLECEDDYIKDFFFDKDYYEERELNVDCSVAEFRAINKEGDQIFISLYNDHNGYYGHGFTFGDIDKTIQEGEL